MEDAHNSLQQLLHHPNAATHQLQQIRRADTVISSQRTSLSKAQAGVDALSSQYGKLIKVTQEKKGSVDIQRVAERLEQQLRVLERTQQILEENRKL
jgi:uncharacterized membrane protein YheB (UPF0754 family)